MSLVYETLKNLDWFESNNLIKLIDQAPNLQRLHMAGGEPLITKEHNSLLEHLVLIKKSEQLTLSYNTNLTQLSDKLIGLWKNFQAVSVMVSLDAYDELNSYIRYPSSWKQIHKNFEKLHVEESNVNFINCAINVTVQSYNIFGLCELIRYLYQWRHTFKTINLSPLFYPQELSVQVLPENLKKLAEEKINKFIDGDFFASMAQSDYLKNIKNKLKSIIEFMHKKDESILFEKFRDRTNFFDKNRHGRKLSQIVSEFNADIISGKTFSND